MVYSISIENMYRPKKKTARVIYFCWVGCDETVCVLNVFIFATEKSITFKRTKMSY